MNAAASCQPSQENSKTASQSASDTLPGNSTSRRLVLVILLCVGFFSLVHIGLAVERSIFCMRPFLSHDEAEHLQVSFQIKLGERPYVDFIENHPTLFNHMLNAAFDLCAARTTRHQFLVAKILIYAHFFICFGIISLVLRRILGRHGFSPPPAILPLISLGCLAPWGIANSSIWEVRPDWLCHAYAVLCVYHHWRAHDQTYTGGPSMARLLAAAVLGGIGTAILAKTILVFIPYALVVLTSPGLRHIVSDISQRHSLKRLIRANAAFVLVFLSALAGCVALDLRLSHVSLRDYWIANMTINSIPHVAFLPFINDFCNPIQRINDLLGFGSIVFLGLSALFSPLTGFSSPCNDKASDSRRLCSQMAFVTVIISVILPTLTNRSVWPQYFSPALLALILLTSLAIDKFFARIIPMVADAVRRFSPIAAVRAPFFLAAAAGLFLLYQTAGRVIWSDRPFQKNVSKEAGYYSYYGRIDFLPDLFMPTNLTYWIFDPQTVPVHGRRWGYFFMLSRDRRFWNDVAGFGLTTAPEKTIQKSFHANPPDVISLADECDFANRCHILMLSNSIKLDWLWPFLQKDYLRASRMGLSVLIHARHADLFRSLWWTLTPLAETLDVIQLECYSLPPGPPGTLRPERFTQAGFH